MATYPTTFAAFNSSAGATVYGLNTAATTLAVNYIVSSEAERTCRASSFPPCCAGFADGNTKFMAERGPGGFVNIDDTDPAGQRALAEAEGPGLRLSRAGRRRAGEVLRQARPRGPLVPALPRKHHLALVDPICPSAAARRSPSPR